MRRFLHHRTVGLCLALVALVVCSCGKKPEPPAPAAPAPVAVTIDSAPGANPEPAPPPPAPVVAAVDASGEPAKEPPPDMDPVTKQQFQELGQLNRGLQAFIAKHQRLPKDFTEFAQNIDGVPLPPPGKYWVIDPVSKTVRSASKK